MDHLDGQHLEEEPETEEVLEDEVQLGSLSEFLGYHLRLAQEASFQAFTRRVNQNGFRSEACSLAERNRCGRRTDWRLSDRSGRRQGWAAPPTSPAARSLPIWTQRERSG